MLRVQWRYALWGKLLQHMAFYISLARLLTRISSFAALWTSIGSMMLGFDYVIGGQLAALTEVQKFFGVQLSDGTWIVPATVLSAWGAIGLGCHVITAWFAAPLFEKFGRKPLIIVAAVISTAAILLQQLAPNWRVHLAGRAVNGSVFQHHTFNGCG